MPGAPTVQLRAVAAALVALLCVVVSSAPAAAHPNTQASASAEPLTVRWIAPLAGSATTANLTRSDCQVTASDRGARIVKVDFTLDGTLVTRDYGPPYDCRIDVANLTPGTHILKARAYDARGNVLAAYQFVTTPSATGTPNTTFTVQGDSLTVGSWWRMPEFLGPNYQLLSVSAHIGRPSGIGLSLLGRQPLGQVVVFALGTNDWWDTAAHYREHLMAVLRMIGPTRCLVAATIWRHHQPNRALNAVLTSVAQRLGPARLQVAPWALAMAAGHVRTGDGTHPNTQPGWELRSRLMATAIRACTSAGATPSGTVGSTASSS